MKHIVFNLKTYLLMGFCISIALMSCEDSDDDLGISINPNNERLLVFSDSSATTKIYGIQTDNLIEVNTSYGLLGHMFDPLLGDYQSHFIAHGRPTVSSLDLGDSVIIDSMFLYIKYDTIFGVSNEEQHLKIYEMMLGESYSLSDLSGEPNEMATIESYYDGSSVVAESYYTPLFREADTTFLEAIKIDMLQTEHGQDIANRLVLSPDSLYNSQPWVQEFIFNGLFFESEKRSEPGAIMRVIPNDSTRLTIYYTKLTYSIDSTTFEDTTAQALNFEFYSLKKANIYENNYNSDVQIFDTANEPEAIEIDSTFFIHGMNGIDGRLIITGFLDSLPDDTYIAINRAIISIQAEDSAFLQEADFPVIPALSVYVDDDNPYLDELVTYNNGTLTYQPVALSNGKYTFTVTSRIIQYRKEERNEIIFKLKSPYNHESPNRIGIKGQGNATFSVKLRLTYTKINSD